MLDLIVTTNNIKTLSFGKKLYCRSASPAILVISVTDVDYWKIDLTNSDCKDSSSK